MSTGDVRSWRGWWLACTLLVAREIPSAAAAELTYDRVRFSVSAAREVPSDVVVATLYVQVEGRDQRALADEVNRTMRWAMDRAKREDTVTAETLNYTTTPVYQNQRITAWRARQSLELTGRDPGALTVLVGDLQERLAVGAIAYELSREVRDEIEQALIDEALARVSARAARIAEVLGRPGYRIVELRIGDQGYRPPMPLYRAEARMQSAAAAPPVVEAGDQSLTVSIDAAVELDPERRQGSSPSVP